MNHRIGFGTVLFALAAGLILGSATTVGYVRAYPEVVFPSIIPLRGAYGQSIVLREEVPVPVRPRRTDQAGPFAELVPAPKDPGRCADAAEPDGPGTMERVP